MFRLQISGTFVSGPEEKLGPPALTSTSEVEEIWEFRAYELVSIKWGCKGKLFDLNGCEYEF